MMRRVRIIFSILPILTLVSLCAFAKSGTSTQPVTNQRVASDSLVMLPTLQTVPASEEAPDTLPAKRKAGKRAIKQQKKRTTLGQKVRRKQLKKIPVQKMIQHRYRPFFKRQ